MMNYPALKQHAYLVVTLLVLTLLGSSFKGGVTDRDDLPDSIRMAVDSLNKFGLFAQTYRLGTGGTPSAQYDYADWLRRNATADQLATIAMTGSSPVTRLWALRLLLEEPHPQVVDVLKAAVNDTTETQEGYGCLYSNMPFNLAAFKNYYFDQENVQTKETQEAIDSMAFFDFMRRYDYDTEILEQLEPKPSYYAAAAEAADSGRVGILPLLVKYKNPNDRQRINRLLMADFEKEGEVSAMCCNAVETWGKPDFEDYAKHVCQAVIGKPKDYNADFYLPLLFRYPAPWSYQLIENVLAGKDRYSDIEDYKEYMKSRADEGEVPPLFQSLYDRYMQEKRSVRSGRPQTEESRRVLKMAVDALNKESYFAESEKKGTYPTYRLEQIDYTDSIYYNATTDQLVALATSSPSHITRLWALRFLSEEPNKHVLGILRRAINDTTSVWLMSRMGVHQVEPYNRLAFRYYNGASTKWPEEMQTPIDNLLFFVYMKRYGYGNGLLGCLRPLKRYHPTIIKEADKGNTDVLTFLLRYKNPNDIGRINKLLRLDLKKKGKQTDMAYMLQIFWKKPDFEWYVKTICLAADKDKGLYYDPRYISLMWDYPAPWSYHLFEKILSGNDPLTIKDVVMNVLREKSEQNAVPTAFRPLIKKYVEKER